MNIIIYLLYNAIVINMCSVYWYLCLNRCRAAKEFSRVLLTHEIRHVMWSSFEIANQFALRIIRVQSNITVSRSRRAFLPFSNKFRVRMNPGIVESKRRAMAFITMDELEQVISLACDTC